MDIKINPNPAQRVSAVITESFKDFADKVFQSTKRPVQYGNRKPVTLEPDSKYHVILLKVLEFMTEDQQTAFMEIFKKDIMAAIKKDIFPKDWLQDIVPLFEWDTPAIPNQYIDEKFEHKIVLTGHTQFIATRESIHEELAQEENDEVKGNVD